MTVKARRESRAVGVCVAEDVGVDVGVGLEAHDQSQVRQVHPGRHLATFVTGLRQNECKQSLV